MTTRAAPAATGTRGTIQIIGAGIGGLTAGIALRRRGWDVTVRDQAPALGEVGAGLQIGPNGLKVLTELGLMSRLTPHLTFPDRIELTRGDTAKVIASVPLGAIARARYGAGYAQAHRADLIDVLAQGFAAEGGQLVLGRRVDPVALPQADLVVGADGVRSALREKINAGTAPVFTGHVAWRALVPRQASDPAPDCTRVYFGPGAHVVIYPLRGGSLWNIVAVEERATWPPEGWSSPADPADMRTAFGGWCPQVTGLLARIEDGLLWGLFGHAPVARWWARTETKIGTETGTRPVALLGDACHPMQPYLAQGAVMAIEDAWVLAQCLDETEAIPPALARYEDLRKSRATRVQKTAARNGRLYHLPAGPARMAVHAAMAGTARLPGGLLRGLDWLYGHDVTRR